MTTNELAAILQVLLEKHPNLRSEAESIAIDSISSPSVEGVAEDVFDAVTSLDIDSLNARAGRQPWGYVEPTEAAWELVEETVEDHFADMKRRVDLGLHAAAEAVCCGIVLGLHRAKAADSDGPLGWAPDFLEENACHAVAELIRSYPARNRRAIANRLVEAVAHRVPDWHKMIARAGDRALKSRL